MNEQTRKAQDCRDEMCACRGGPVASCQDGEREKEAADLRESLSFYKRRADALQQAQSKMRDPERTMACDILANGFLLVPAGNRYDAPAPAPAAPVAPDPATVALIRECAAAFDEELAAYDIDPPIHHVKQGSEKCHAWLRAHGIRQGADDA